MEYLEIVIFFLTKSDEFTPKIRRQRALAIRELRIVFGKLRIEITNFLENSECKCFFIYDLIYLLQFVIVISFLYHSA